VREQVDIVIDDLAATLVEAQATTDDAGIAAGTSRLAYLIDLEAAGTLTLLTIGVADDDAYAARAAMLTVMVALSTFTAPDG
jgi:hypothetical protein